MSPIKSATGNETDRVGPTLYSKLQSQVEDMLIEGSQILNNLIKGLCHLPRATSATAQLDNSNIR